MSAFKLIKADNGVEYLSIKDIDDNYNVRTFFSTRTGGVSTGEYYSLNTGFLTDDADENVAENRRLLFDSLQIDYRITASMQQVHKSDIVCVDNADITIDIPIGSSLQTTGSSSHKNGVREIRYAETDALITNKKGVILSSLHADCIPLYFYDYINHAAGIAHAGWRGTAALIGQKTVEMMNYRFGTEPQNVIAAVGPGIGQCCFETGEDVYNVFAGLLPDVDNYAVKAEDGWKYHLNLAEINKRILQNSGVKNVIMSDYCTSCAHEMFFSYRHENGKTGRMCAGICLL